MWPVYTLEPIGLGFPYFSIQTGDFRQRDKKVVLSAIRQTRRRISNFNVKLITTEIGASGRQKLIDCPYTLSLD